MEAAEARRRIEEDYRRGIISGEERAMLLKLLDRHPEAVKAFLDYLEALAELKERLG
jgi:hypothetical protein